MKRTTKWLALVLLSTMVTNSMAVYSAGDAVLPSPMEETASDTVELAPAFQTAGEEVVEWREEGVRHYYLGNGQYQAVVSADYVEDNVAAPAATTPNSSVMRDTYISSANPTTNYGTYHNLQVSDTQTAFFYFNKPSLPDNADITNAKLYFTYQTDDYDNTSSTPRMSVGAYPVNFSWSESSLTWNQANSHADLGLDACVATATLNEATSPRSASLAITNEVRLWYMSNLKSNLGIAIKRRSGSISSISIKSREASITNGPYFVITYSTVNLPIESGEYYIQNAVDLFYTNEAGRYHWACLMQTDNASFTTDTDCDLDPVGVQYCEMRNITGLAEQIWVLEYLHNGYYIIKNKTENQVLAVQEGKENVAEEVVVRENFTGATRQQWKIVLSNSGAYRIKSRATESYSTNLVMGISDGYSYIGRNVKQMAYNGNDDLLNDEWYFRKKGSDIFMLGVNDGSHDHFSCYGTILKSMDNQGYDGFNIQRKDVFSQQEILTHMAESEIYVSRSHGSYKEDGSCIYISEDTTTTGPILSYSDIYDYTNNTPLVDLSNCQLMLFVACETAGPANDINNNYYSICNAAVLAGAEYAVGFTETIKCPDANRWTECFFYSYANNISVDYCCDAASDGDYIDVDADGNFNRTSVFEYDQPDTIASYQVFSENGG